MPIHRLYNNQLRNNRAAASPPPDNPVRAQHTAKRSVYWWKISGALVGVIIVFVLLIGYRILSAVNTAGNGNKKISVFAQLGHLVSNRDAELRGESSDRINVLLLGIGGEGHDGPLLTDTIMVASIKPSTRQVALLSIPRDLAVDIPRYGVRKINSANAFGKDLNYPGGGEQFALDIVSKTLGIPIHYYARIDFAGFKEVIDALGGITINVERGFTDSQYPTANFGYQTVRFSSGAQHMSGATALTFVRSRHGTNGEGSDFARSRRQQLVLEGLRDKALSLGTIINPVKIGNVLGSLGNHTRTNLEVWEMLRLGRLASGVSKDDIITNVLDSSVPAGFLKNVTGIDGAFLLMPKDGTFKAIQTFAKDLFLAQPLRQEDVRVVIRDETGRSGTAKAVGSSLESFGFPAPTIDTSARANADSVTSIIDYTNGQKAHALRVLQDYLGVTAISSKTLSSDAPLPSYFRNSNVNAKAAPSPETVDFVVTLGKDMLSLVTNVQSNGSAARTNTNTNGNGNTNTNTNKNNNTNSTTNKNTNVNASANTNSNTNASPPVNVPLNTNQ